VQLTPLQKWTTTDVLFLRFLPAALLRTDRAQKLSLDEVGFMRIAFAFAKLRQPRGVSGPCTEVGGLLMVGAQLPNAKCTRISWCLDDTFHPYGRIYQHWTGELPASISKSIPSRCLAGFVFQTSCHRGVSYFAACTNLNLVSAIEGVTAWWPNEAVSGCPTSSRLPRSRPAEQHLSVLQRGIGE